MAFDAGAIEARLTIDTSQAKRDLDAVKAEVKAFTDAGHKVKISAVFDDASVSKARQSFAQLDNTISKDAMSRLRSSPQGSVLGALNALFSPHPVTGAPSAQQAASQGLLGKIVSQPVTGSSSSGGGTSSSSPGSATVGQVLSSSAARNSGSTVGTSRVNVVGLPGSNTISTKDRVTVTGLPVSGGTITTVNKIKPQLDKTALAATEAASAASGGRAGRGWAGGFLSSVRRLLGGGGGSSQAGVLDKGLIGGIGPGILGTSFKAASLTGLGAAGLGALPALIGGALPLGVGAAGLGVAALGAKTLIGTKNQTGKPATQGPLYDQAQAAGKALQAMIQTAAAGLVKPLESLFSQIPALAKQVTPALTQIFTGAAALIKPAVAGLVDIVKEIGPGLSKAFQAAGPLLQPLLAGLGNLVGGLLPGLTSLLKAAAPAVAVVSGFFGSLGSNLGTMFKQFSTVIGPSSVILKALLDVVTGLLPIIGGLAQVMAAALGPAFTAFAGTVKALEPFLLTVGKIIAQFAGAVLIDLAAGLQLVAGILKAVAPAFDTLATALGQVFSTLESKGGFAQLGNILETLATPVGNLIKSLVSGLAPAIPPLLTLFAALVNIISTVGVQVLTALLPPLTKLATEALGAVVKILPVVVPLITRFLNAFTQDAAKIILAIAVPLANLASVVLVKLLIAAAPLIPVIVGLLNAFTPLINVLTPVFVRIISDLAQALIAVIQAIPPGVLQGIALTIIAIVGAVKLWAAAQAILDVALSANPIALITIAIAALVIGLVELANHWSTVWAAIKAVGSAVYQWILNDFANPIINFFTKSIPNAWDDAVRFFSTKFVTPIENAGKSAISWVNANFVTPLANFFTKTIPAAWDSSISYLNSHFVTPFKNDLLAAYQWVVKNVANPIQNLFTKTIPGWFGTAVSAISKFWGGVENAVESPVKFVVNNVIDKLINVFDDVTNAVGLGKPIPTITLAGGGKIPGFGGGDTVPALLEPGEAVIDKDKTRQYAWLFKLLGVPGFAAGGVAGGPVLGSRGGGNAKAGKDAPGTFGSIVGSVIGGVGDLGKAVLAIATGNSVALSNAVLAMLGASSSGGMGGTVGKALLGMPATLTGDFAKWVLGAGKSGAVAATATPVSVSGSVVSWLTQAIKDTGVSPSWLSDLEIIAKYESGGNPNAINLTDSNAAAGHPSQGLMQTIPGTFSAYHQAGTSNNILDPIANAAAAINYIKAVYGSVASVPGVKSVLAGGSYVGYDNGGYLKPGYTLAYNGTGKPERVTTGSQETSTNMLLSEQNELLRQLIGTTAAVPAGVGRHVGGALNGAAADASFRNRYPRGGS